MTGPKPHSSLVAAWFQGQPLHPHLPRVCSQRASSGGRRPSGHQGHWEPVKDQAQALLGGGQECSGKVWTWPIGWGARRGSQQGTHVETQGGEKSSRSSGHWRQVTGLQGRAGDLGRHQHLGRGGKGRRCPGWLETEGPAWRSAAGTGIKQGFGVLRN